jgi:ABC-type glycerol-3-phosphate transport system substrate-binding protein
MFRRAVLTLLLLALLTACAVPGPEPAAPAASETAEHELRVVTLGGMPHEYMALIDGFHASQDRWRIVLEDCSDEEEQDRLQVDFLTGGGRGCQRRRVCAVHLER